MEFEANFRQDRTVLSNLFPEKPIKPEFPTRVPLQSSPALNNKKNCNSNTNTFQHFLQHPTSSMNVSNPSFVMEGSSSSNPFSGMPPTTTLCGVDPFKQANTNWSLTDFVNAYYNAPPIAPNNNTGALHGYLNQPSATPLWDFSQKVPVLPSPARSSLNLPPYQPPLYNEDYRSGLKPWIHDQLSAFTSAHGWGESTDQRAEDKKKKKKKKKTQKRRASRPERTSNFIKGQWTPEEDLYI